MSDQVSRRSFISEGAGLGALAAGLLLGERPAEAVAGGAAQVVALSFDEHKDLAKVGGSVLASLPDAKRTEIIVARPETDRFICCSARCPRDNGLLSYDHKAKQLVCADNGCRYDLDGKPVAGNPKDCLRSFEADQAVVVKVTKGN